MPPKKRVKDIADAPVYNMAHEEQVQLLSDALLREYMHRRGFLQTLKAFDHEHPRDEKTISSRALMSDLVALKPDDQQRMKGEGIETIMEMLCNLRVERRLETERLKAELEVPLSKVPADYEALKCRHAEREACKAEGQVARRTPSKKSKASGSTIRNHGSDATDGVHQQRNIRHGKRHQRRSGTLPSGSSREIEPSGITIEDLLGSSHSSADNLDGRASLGEEENNVGSCTSNPAEHAKANLAPKSPVSCTDLSSSRSASAPTTQPAWMEVASKQKSPLPKGNRGGGDAPLRACDKADGDNDDELVNSEAGKDSDDDADLIGGAAMTAEQRDELSTAFQLLCGFEGCLHTAFLEQGFTFDDCAECALIQWQPGGCDGIIAPVQAFVSAYYYERELYVRKEQRQRECLAKALCTCLEQAQPNASKIVLIDSSWKNECGSSHYTRSHALRQAAQPRTRCWANMASMQEVARVLLDTLLTEKHWMDPRGGGLVSFLFSLLLSRGVDRVQQELATASFADSGRPSLLIPTSGRATLSLVNLVLTGRATPFRHNGIRNGNQVGYSSRLRCGVLCGKTGADSDEDRSAAASSTASSPISHTHAKEPQFPSWVLWHGDSFANVYMTKDTRQHFQQKRALGGSASADLVYWDAATEDEEYSLTVTVRDFTFGAGSGSGGTARNAKSFVNTAITSIPAWSSAVIDWCGKVPLRD
ncbi:hypothetical protein JKF63_01199 [Porcisia hertigi]|uniref:Probable ubiquitin carboxyl-terminal hydrolase MINDY-4 n=1 Tax=Porcisia hertigi TaxID=2761500 RepID=A0A836L341_9TRYP|nr:hypothetical protein JKF63_01199 [Porcisia hertigi]